MRTTHRTVVAVAAAALTAGSVLAAAGSASAEPRFHHVKLSGANTVIDAHGVKQTRTFDQVVALDVNNGAIETSLARTDDAFARSRVYFQWKRGGAVQVDFTEMVEHLEGYYTNHTVGGPGVMTLPLHTVGTYHLVATTAGDTADSTITVTNLD